MFKKPYINEIITRPSSDSLKSNFSATRRAAFAILLSIFQIVSLLCPVFGGARGASKIAWWLKGLTINLSSILGTFLVEEENHFLASMCIHVRKEEG